MRLIRRLIARFRRAPQPRVIGRITSITESADGLHITGELDAEAREGAPRPAAGAASRGLA